MSPLACEWRIAISAKIPQDFPSCDHSSMRNLAVLFIHLFATLARLLGPGGVRSLVAESLLLKHQLLILNRSRQRSPNLSTWDRILAGWLALWVRPTRLLRSMLSLREKVRSIDAHSKIWNEYSLPEEAAAFLSATAPGGKNPYSPFSSVELSATRY